ncbi:Signal-peptide peptidase, presenilin aspartyl protease [Candidatus Gugararchaeum adminiculabundum]|nr:Signal-peptide peptidase, presenilin aspartyl protease [Candidatus Gugararchaeum adminiculabundum]
MADEYEQRRDVHDHLHQEHHVEIPHERIMATILIMFLLTQALGLYAGAQLTNKAPEIQEFKELSVAPTGNAGDLANVIFFIAYVLVGAAIMLIVIKFYKGVMAFKLMEVMIVMISGYVIGFALLRSFNVPNSSELAFAVAALLAITKFFFKKAKNLVAIIASAGVGAIFGFSLDVVPAIVFISALSVYDVLAVYYTRHMITMAKELGKRNLSFSVSAEEEIEPKKLKNLTEDQQQQVHEHLQSLPPEHRRTALELGTGDMAIPLMLAVAVLKWGGWVDSIAVIIGTTFGLGVVLYVVLKNRLFLPALPPLCFFGMLSLLIAKLAGF